MTTTAAQAVEQLSEEQREALEHARELARLGVPVFVAHPDSASSTGFRLPKSWHTTSAQPAYVDAWRPGLALCAVMGCGVDLVDIDPRNGGDRGALGHLEPRALAEVATPSGGTHLFIRSLGVRSRDNVLPGIDVKAGDAEGRGRGFAFIAPTVRVSKITGQPTAYRYREAPRWAELAVDDDRSGAALAAHIVSLRANTVAPVASSEEQYAGPAFAELDSNVQHAVTRWTLGAVAGITGELAEARDWPAGHTDASGRGWERLCADAAWNLARLARASWCPLSLAEAEQKFLTAAPVDADWTPAVLGAKWQAQRDRGEPRPWPRDLHTDSLSDLAAQSWQEFGVSVPATTGADTELETRLDAAAQYARDVAAEAHRLRVRRQAQELVDAELNTVTELPGLSRLDEFLATPDADVTHRVAGLWPTGGRVVLSAQHKAGKTTLVGNLVRSLVDGSPFLERFPAERVGRAVLLDNELDERMLRRWLRDHKILSTERVDLVAMRGRLSTFDLLTPATRSRWAEHIGPADVLILDCLRPALDALALSEDKDAGRFLEALDELTAEAGIAETVVVHHMGHNGERSRGDSRILDWPDALWKLVRENEDQLVDTQQNRVYFTAYGRDVDQPETLLSFDAETRRLTVTGGGRQDTRAEDLVTAVLEYLEDHPGASKNGIEKAITGHAPDVRRAVTKAVERGLVKVEKDGAAHRHTLTSSNSSNLVRDERTNQPRDLVHSSIDEDEDERDERTNHRGDLVRDEPCRCGVPIGAQLPRCAGCPVLPSNQGRARTAP